MSQVYEAYIAAYMKTNKCSRDVAIASVDAMLSNLEQEEQGD